MNLVGSHLTTCIQHKDYMNKNEIAKKYGSKTGKLKKKHLNRVKEHQDFLMILNEGHKLSPEYLRSKGYSEEEIKAIRA